ncbi:MAG TPA: PIN domain-containing protein [Blastocatellia bacterium]|nr:PIN domain-containing protein [Blastocatellia bacterium]HMX28290.1 PIN domain-containing protein [Blastocatellia bacterium]
MILDSCVLINLLASEEIEEILRSSGKECRICVVVEKESFYLRPDDPQEELFDSIKLEPLIKSGILSLCDIESSQEATLYVDYASRLGDGEAMSLAIAESRGYVLATDDRKARRIFIESGNDPDSLISTSDLVRTWVDSQSVSPAKLKSVLMNIQHKAHFFPSRKDSNFAWWSKASG